MSFLRRAAVVAVFLWQYTTLCAGAVEAAGQPGVPSCTPELVYVAEPGTVTASGSGVAFVPSLDLTDKDGNPLATGGAAIEWLAESVVESPADVGAKPILGGQLKLVITTEEGHRITFDATCIAGSGALSEDGFQVMFVFATGIAKGWPGIPAQNVMTFFQAFTFGDGDVYVFVQMFNGRDCSLNFETRLTTHNDFFPGPGSLSVSPEGLFYGETDCTARRGDPKPPEKAPGQLD
jgi:hypothetical protein